MEIANNCQTCGKLMTFQADGPFAETIIKAASRVVKCDVCLGLSTEKTEADAKAKADESALIGRALKWETICPPEFRQKIDRNKLADAQHFDEAQNWMFQPKGLALHGKTRKGKTRALWHLLRRIYVQEGLSIEILNAMSAVEYGALYGKGIAGAESAAEWFRRLIACDVLAMDDIFKTTLSNSFEMAIFNLINERTQWHRPILLTFNDDYPEILKRTSADRGEPIVERLKEFTDSIAFL